MISEDLERIVGGLEAQVNTLVSQVTDMRKELSELRSVLLRETLTHHERLTAIYR